MQISPPSLKPGQQVFIRRGRWQILDVHQFEGCELLTVVSSEARHSPPFEARRSPASDRGGFAAESSGAFGSGGGAFNASVAATRRHFLTPFDEVEAVDRVRRPRFVRGAPWRRECRALLAADTPPGSLQSI